MNYQRFAAKLLVAACSCSAAWAQDSILQEPAAPAQVLPGSASGLQPMVQPSALPAVQPGATTIMAPTDQTLSSGNLQTESSDAFLTSLADRFGTSKQRLQSLLNKIPPRGQGLSSIEIAVISAKLKLSPEEKAIMKSKVGAGGTGFNSNDIADMGARLGLSNTEIGRLAQELGLNQPAVATGAPPETPAVLQNNQVMPGNTIPAAYPGLTPASTVPAAYPGLPPNTVPTVQPGI